MKTCWTWSPRLLQWTWCLLGFPTLNAPEFRLIVDCARPILAKAGATGSKEQEG